MLLLDDRVVVAVSRTGAQLRPSDFQLWRDLHAELRGTQVDLLPVRALPAASRLSAPAARAGRHRR